ncbi:hypothetical protein Dimus_019961, partial [Dionaea muscipula]
MLATRSSHAAHHPPSPGIHHLAVAITRAMHGAPPPPCTKLRRSSRRESPAMHGAPAVAGSLAIHASSAARRGRSPCTELRRSRGFSPCTELRRSPGCSPSSEGWSLGNAHCSRRWEILSCSPMEATVPLFANLLVLLLVQATRGRRCSLKKKMTRCSLKLAMKLSLAKCLLVARAQAAGWRGSSLPTDDLQCPLANLKMFHE